MFPGRERVRVRVRMRMRMGVVRRQVVVVVYAVHLAGALFETKTFNGREVLFRGGPGRGQTSVIGMKCQMAQAVG